MTRRRGPALCRLFGRAALTALLLAAGCFGPHHGAAPPPPDLGGAPAYDNESPAASAVFAPVIPIPEGPSAGTPLDNETGASSAGTARTEATATIPPEPAASSPPAGRPQAPPEVAATGRETAPASEAQKAGGVAETARAAARSEEPTHRRSAAAPVAAPAKAPKPAVSREPETTAQDASPGVPGWARKDEVLAYRVDFSGITMGYARFVYRGKVSIGGQAAYHLSVRAWTSGVLSYIYPINETIDYYLDVDTLAPIRQEFTERKQGKDDVALYNQATGKITYRYRQSGEIRKQVETVPEVYDPVSAVYYFRWKDLGHEERPRNVYAGRKVWQISARVLGTERLDTSLGEVETLVVQPVIRREGKLEDKGELRMWVSNDARRVPVRLFGKFHKIIDWTLIGELMPVEKRG